MALQSVSEDDPQLRGDIATKEPDCLANHASRDSADDKSKVLHDNEIDADVDQEVVPPPARRRVRKPRLISAFWLAALVTLSALVGWWGFQTQQAVGEQHQRAQFLAAGRDGAVRLTTISPGDVDTKVQTILDFATGPFHEDFLQRSSAFVDTVKRAKSPTQGTVIEAGLESVEGDQAEVLVAVSVKTTVAGTEAPPRLWRMRISIQRIGETEKVSNVQYVP